MDEHDFENAVELVRGLRPTCGLIAQQGVAVVRSPGSPYHDAPTGFSEKDIQNAVELGLLRKTSVIGSQQWDWYVATGAPLPASTISP